MATPLTKSYVNTYDPEYPVKDDLVLYDLFEEARKNGLVGEVVNLETGERMSTTHILEKCEKYAKGLLALGLVPGEDNIVVIGCSTMEAAFVFGAACAIGIGYSHPYVYAPRNRSIPLHLSELTPKLVVVGEGSGGLACTALLDMFAVDRDEVSSDRLPYVEHLFYDNTYKDRSPAHKCLKPLDVLRQLGESITDEQLRIAKENVKPEFVLMHVFTSGSTGKPKCVSHTHRALANEALLLRTRLDTIMILNINVDSMGCYPNISLTLAGRFKKAVMITDMYVERQWLDAARVHTQALVEEKVEYVVLNMSTLRLMANYAANNNVRLHPLKVVAYFGQVISRQYKEENKLLWGGMHCTDYGMSEVYNVAWTNLALTEEAEEERMESKLYPKPNSELRLADENDQVVAIGKDGEVQIKTFSCLKEYRNDPERTKELFTKDGFLKTGDMAAMSPDGTFVIKGRKLDRIRFKILSHVEYPGPIEAIVAQHPDIADISVVAGGCNDWLGDELTYCIRMKPGKAEPTEKEMLEHCTQHGMCNDRQRPARIFYFDELPTVPNGRKVSKPMLREKIRAMVENENELGKCQWFIDLEKQVSAT